MSFASTVANGCWDLGLISRSLWENVSLSPPLCTTKEDVDEIVGIMIKAMNSATEKYNKG
jgi:adenosylmethionine-8-amino-7-oxononanoate aminotransferase